MHNTNSNSNSSSTPQGPLDWGNRFVPLPPTEFPDDVAFNASENERLPVEPGNSLESPVAAPNLPCLQDIAGIDPFFTPMQTPASSPQLSAANSAALPQTNAASFGDGTPERNILNPPQVEVIGQQAQKESHTYAENTNSIETPLAMQEPTNAKVELEETPRFQKPIVEIHEYDLATKMSPFVIAAESQGSKDSQGQSEADDIAGSPKADISKYWSQDNVSSFIPGITPVEAYPVCQEYAEQISVSGESKSITLSDIQLGQLLAKAATIKSETVSENASDTETSQSSDQTAVDAQAASTAVPTLVPPLVDPFENDEFDSTFELSLPKTSNRFGQNTPTPLAEESLTHDTAAEQTETYEIALPKCADSPESFDSQEPLPIVPQVVPQIPNLAARQVVSPPEHPQETTEAISQPAIEEVVVNPETSSDELFDSVEKSLSDLQRINECESNEDLAPARNAHDILSAITTPNIGESTALADLVDLQQEPAVEQHTAAEELEAEQFNAVAQTSSASTFVPVDLTAHLPSVQAEALQTQTEAESEVAPQPAPEDYQTITAVPEVSYVAPQESAFTPVDASRLQANYAAVEQIQPMAETEHAPEDFEEPTSAPLASIVEPTTPSTFEPIDTAYLQPTHTPVVEIQSIIEPEDALQQTPVDHSASEVSEALVADSETQLTTVEINVDDEALVESEPEVDSDCQIIQVDGDDGYDFLDLKAFDVAHATFCPGKIFLDDGKTKFQIQYRNLTLAVFANDIQIELS